VLLLELGEVGEYLPDEVLGFAVDAEAVFELVVLLGDHGMVVRGQGTGGEDRYLLVLGQQRHGREGRFRAHRPADDEVGFLV